MLSISFLRRRRRDDDDLSRPFTRLTNGFSKKVENHAWVVSLHLMHYNFARIHKTLRVTPAMEAGVADHVWSMEEIEALGAPVAPAKRGPYKKREVVTSA